MRILRSHWELSRRFVNFCLRLSIRDFDLITDIHSHCDDP